jgi:hypothetical protein
MPMRSAAPSPSSWSVVGLYAFGLLLFFWPFADLVTNALPIRLHNVQWRYGFAGLMAAYLNTPILGLVLATGVAYGLRHGRALRLLSVLQLLVAVSLLLVIGVFALDLLQVRASRPEAARPAVLAGGGIAILKHLTAATVLALLGIGGWRTANRFRGAGAPSGGSAGIVARKKAGGRAAEGAGTQGEV